MGAWICDRPPSQLCICVSPKERIYVCVSAYLLIFFLYCFASEYTPTYEKAES